MMDARVREMRRARKEFTKDFDKRMNRSLCIAGIGLLAIPGFFVPAVRWLFDMFRMYGKLNVSSMTIMSVLLVMCLLIICVFAACCVDVAVAMKRKKEYEKLSKEYGEEVKRYWNIEREKIAKMSVYK